MNLATLLEGPANLTHRSAPVHFRGGLTLTPLADLFEIGSDLYGALDRRMLERAVAISGTPVGVYTAAQIAMLYRWQNPTIGQMLTPRYDIDSVETTDNEITLVGSAVPRTGCPVLVDCAAGGTIIAPLVAGTLYYWGAAGTLHSTEAAAIAGTGAIDLTDDGTGDQYMIEQEPIIIDAISANRRITFHNGALSVMPPLIMSAIQTILGPATFVAFVKNDVDPTTANSLYTVEKVALTDTPPVKTDIPTQAYSCAFGASPWDAFKSRGPVTITPTMGLDPVSTDDRGTVGMRISSMAVGATLTPQGFTEAQMLDLLGLQGAGSGRGATKIRGDLVVSGTGVHVTMYNGAPRQLPQTFSTTGPRAGELAIDGAWKSGSGWLRVGTAAP